MSKLQCLVRGLGDVGSAVAHLLFGAGHDVVLHDGPAPTAHRRRMSFVDAAFDRVATLDGVSAHLTDAPKVADVLAAHREIPACTGEFDRLCHAIGWDVLIDARMHKRATPESQRGLARLVIGLGPGFIAGETADVVIETGWDDLGTIIRHGASAPLRGEPRAILGHARNRLVYAPRAGHFTSSRAIGELVAAGDTVAFVDGHPLTAPLAGAIRGLTRSNVPVETGTKVIEIDPRGAQAVFTGLGERPRRIAEGVARAIAEWQSGR
jgi:xanthine dehydrogenase accessory factor